MAAILVDYWFKTFLMSHGLAMVARSGSFGIAAGFVQDELETVRIYLGHTLQPDFGHNILR